ncbi:hypothetical protein ACIBG8_29895 [Nonomuraea sp. NPDC050556]|uniref:hypothetical protein n=1 Tax=Nonomuraea sp. NPDC050556 TaxID=3364369 RepID=UPI0037964FEB
MLLTRPLPVLSAPAATRGGHRVFAVVLAVAALLRVVMMLAYDTAQVYWYDSFTYMDNALHLRPPGAFHPAGYSAFLWFFRDVRVVAGVQHALGLGIGLLIYALLRRKGLPGWGAALATVPVLFNPAFLRLEHAVLSETLLILLIVGAVTALMWEERPSPRLAAAAGLLIACAALTRTAAAPLLGLLVLFLLVRRAGPRPVVALTLAGALPLLAYAGWFAQHHGRFALSGSDGIALWARTMTFADCSVIEPSPVIKGLCPNGTVVDAASEYVWAPGASLNRLGGDRFQYNALAREFAVKAILAQPFDYLRDVASDASLAFTLTPVAHPKRVVPALGYPVGSWGLPEEHALIGQVRRSYDPGIKGLSSVQPWVSVLNAVPYPWLLHGPLFGIMLLVGVRRVSLPWLASVFLFLGPIAALDFDHRYLLPAIPLACVAAALAIRPLCRDLRRLRGALRGR